VRIRNEADYRGIAHVSILANNLARRRESTATGASTARSSIGCSMSRTCNTVQEAVLALACARGRDYRAR
jgi:hypothetical protein